MFFGLSPLELVVLAGLALALFGPEKLPGAVREAARFVRHIRSAGESARAELLEQLGPELAEIDPRRLHPQALLRETFGDVFDPLRSAHDDVRHELRDVRDVTRFDDHADRLAAVEAVPRAAAMSSTASAEAAEIPVVEIPAMPRVAPDAQSDAVRVEAVDHVRGAGSHTSVS